MAGTCEAGTQPPPAAVPPQLVSVAVECATTRVAGRSQEKRRKAGKEADESQGLLHQVIIGNSSGEEGREGREDAHESHVRSLATGN